MSPASFALASLTRAANADGNGSCPDYASAFPLLCIDNVLLGQVPELQSASVSSVQRAVRRRLISIWPECLRKRRLADETSMLVLDVSQIF